MATMQELTIKRREGSGKAFSKRLRREGTVPAVLYDGKKAESVTVDPKAVLRMIHGHEGTTQLLTLRFDGENGNGTRMAIIRDLTVRSRHRSALARRSAGSGRGPRDHRAGGRARHR
jgi:ribosomal protein L25 (general stress protein Ctc)